MKRILLLFWVLLFVLTLPACIRLDPLDGDDTSNTATEDGSRNEVDSTATDGESEQETQKQPELTLPIWSDADGTAQIFFEATDTIVDSTKREYSYAEMYDDLAALSAAYPNRFTYESIGQSVAGREIYAICLGNPNAPRQILVSAGIHGREYLTPLLAMKQLEFYLRYWNVGAYNGIRYPDLFDRCAFYIVPMSNPDGIMLSQAGIDSITDTALRQKVESVYESDRRRGYTSQTDIDEYLKFWKANANGVDLNRNFDALWADYRGEPTESHKNYKGSSAASEPETRALAALTESLSNPVAVLCIHSQGEVLYWDCGQSQPLRDNTLTFTREIANQTGYTIVYEVNNDASFSDWCALNRGLIAITVETGIGSCPLFIDKFTAIWTDNYDLLPLSAYYFEQNGAG